MTPVTGSPRPNPLAHPTLREDELCHVQGEREGLTLCGAVVNEGYCCGVGQAPCGRPRCPECVAAFRDLTGRSRP